MFKSQSIKTGIVLFHLPINHWTQQEKVRRFYRGIMLLLMVTLFVSSCGNKEKKFENQITFNEMKWNTSKDGHYPYRKQMVNDLLNNYSWVGTKKDSVIQMLGEPDAIEEGNLRYDYEKTPFLGGFGTKIDALVFELTTDSTVKLLRFNGEGWD